VIFFSIEVAVLKIRPILESSGNILRRQRLEGEAAFCRHDSSDSSIFIILVRSDKTGWNVMVVNPRRIPKLNRFSIKVSSLSHSLTGPTTESKNVNEERYPPR
jgi:hypothetical protein